jgi:hypothetical protein
MGMTSPSGAGTSVIEMFDYVWARVTGRLVGLTDEEYFWEPVVGCWSLRLGDDGEWTPDGGGGGGPAPDPAPVTTIAWRVGHMAGMALGGFADRLFGDEGDEGDDSAIVFPAAATAVPQFLADNYGRWRAGMANLDTEGWQRPLGAAWGPYSESTILDLALHVLDEVIHHGAEVGLLRDLYLHRATLGS